MAEKALDLLEFMDGFELLILDGIFWILIRKYVWREIDLQN